MQIELVCIRSNDDSGTCDRELRRIDLVWHLCKEAFELFAELLRIAEIPGTLFTRLPSIARGHGSGYTGTTIKFE